MDLLLVDVKIDRTGVNEITGNIVNDSRSIYVRSCTNRKGDTASNVDKGSALESGSRSGRGGCTALESENGSEKAKSREEDRSSHD